MDGAEEDTDSEVEEYSGMEQPPLIKQLKTILAEYPDDGQIIKELVQNAEDAEASEMKILYDGRTINTATMKKLPYRKFFKAPALCFYNNEVFSETDWRGIKMIYSSVKEEDPLKVGRFGLGFKSVFHITDNPCIISGNKILLMNPHEKVPHKVCITMKLKDLKKCKRMNVEEFLEALMGTFGFSTYTLNSGNYNGTILWFPLRETPSELSDTCYDQGKVLDLFKSYQTEAIHSLLFLKSLRRVELCCRGSGTEYDLPDGQEFFSVELSAGNGLIKEERSEFLREIKDTAGKIPDADIVCVAHPKFKTRFRNAGMLEVEETESSWLVINVYKGGKMSEKLKQLVSDRDLSYSPYVGAAVLLSDCGEPFKGHVFCFLPLPQENKSLTGLPIHFNGFFALSQNRRHLKWASADQETLHMHRDKAIEWNECLVNEVLPEVYMRLIKEMITISGNSGNNEEAVEAVYRCIPDISAVDDKWSGCVNSLCQQLLQTDIVFLSNQPIWVQPLRPLYTVFDQQNVSCDKKETVRQTLHQCKNVEITTVPIHIWELLRKIAAPKDITPSELCKIMMLDDIYKRALEPSEKLRLLEYITKDKQLELLKGLELLPIENGSFVTFQETGLRPVFFCTKEETTLFPGLEERFVSTELAAPLEDIMRDLSTSDRYQMKTLTITDTVNLMDTSIRQNFGNEEPIRINMKHNSRFAKWIENVWVYIFKQYLDRLSMFVHLPLLPCLISGKWDDGTWKDGELELYSMNHTFLINGKEELPDGALQALTYLSIINLPSLPDWFDAGKMSCIFNPVGTDLLRLMERLRSSNAQTINCFNNNCKTPDAEALVSLLARISSPFPDSVVTFLRKLKLFKSSTSLTNATSTLTSVSDNSKMLNVSGSFPIHFPHPLLVPYNNSSLELAKILGIETINEEHLVTEVLRAINEDSYGNEEVRTFILWFLSQIYKFQSNSAVIRLAQNVAFVPIGITQYKPSELYDPRDTHLVSLFKGENKFPVGEFASEMNLNAMHHLGLKQKKDISADCLYSTAHLLNRMCIEGMDREQMSTKANALFQIFEEKTEILSAYETQTGKQLHTCVSSLKCIPHKRERPYSYPKDLVWKGSDLGLCSPAELKSDTFSNTAGSVIALVQSSNKLGDFFQWNSKPGARVLTAQLENIITAYSSMNKPEMLPLISNVYMAMADNFSEVINCLDFQKIINDNWIWWGDGFCSPNEIILERRKDDIEVQPYMYPIPIELQSLQGFFTQTGCHLKQDTNALLIVEDMIARKHHARYLTDENETRKDLHKLLQILDKLFQEKANINDLGERLLFPIHTGDERNLVLKPYSQCSYCDAQWLKELTEQEEEDETIIYVHGDVPAKVAERLGVKSLKRQLMSDTEGLEEWGQEEPLTRRLHNILKKDYVDGLAVPKEIIQNADDARATTVQFLYDERENADARTQLLDDKMAECQGPALWAYNNSLFSNDDLKQITKLSGATKETDTTKIGKFGLGFCAVYNLTDVPSFVSGQTMVLFDPHTKYLNNALPGKSTGLKINLRTTKNKKLVKRMHNQFKPFRGMFGCDLSQDEPFFKGTLFRFPLRTPQQAVVSEIKNTAYPREEMDTLLKQFVEASGNMLLFTQNLQEIKLFYVPKSGVASHEAKLLCSVTKEFCQQSFSKTVLEMCSDLKISKSLDTKPFATIQKLVITLKCNGYRSIFEDLGTETSQTNWLVSWATGVSKSLELCYSTNIKGALPLGSVAVLVETDSGCLAPKGLNDAPFGFYDKGHIFCYLPLPIESHLDVHINGNFAVTSNRRNLQMSTEDDKYTYDTHWNEALFSDAVTKAFINLLVGIRDFNSLQYDTLSTSYRFHQFWPKQSLSPISNFESSFYQNVVESTSMVFESKGNWLDLKHCIFLNKDMTEDKTIGEYARSVLQKFRPSTMHSVITLPSEYFDKLQNTSCWKDLSCVVEEQAFFLSFFLPNIGSTFWQGEENQKIRNELLLYCLEHADNKITETLRTLACIPACHDGALRKPRDLVHPNSQLSPLFENEDGRFPDKCFRNDVVLHQLEHLGMMKDHLQSDVILDRAMAISTLSSRDKSEKAFERFNSLISYLSTVENIDPEILHDLRGVAFLPFLEKPSHWPFKWKADETLKRTDLCSDNYSELILFLKPADLYMDECKELVGCTEFIINSSSVSNPRLCTQLLVQLGIKTKTDIKIETVVEQLLAVSSRADITKSLCQRNIEEDVLLGIYGYLNEVALNHQELFDPIAQSLKDKRIIDIESQLLPSNKVAFSLKYDCTPELFEIRSDRLRRYSGFLKAVGVKENFSINDVLQVLKRKQEEFSETILPHHEHQLFCRLLQLLTDRMRESNVAYSDPKAFGTDIVMAPDADNILRPTYSLCLDDYNSVQTSSTLIYIHEDVSRTVADTLGVLTKKRKHQADCSSDIAFEQKEELVTRLHGLLDGYPCDTSVMKELLQNADDANATEVHFVMDFRSHGTSNIFEKYDDYQGAALCVFNDSAFTQDDLIGITNLGRGSKQQDPAKTGKYGVGFNSVYNITDVPSFLTKGIDTKEKETLCLFDPLQKHLEGRVGTRYVKMEETRTNYPDIFTAFNELELLHGREQGTIFRLPLRTSASAISDHVMTEVDLRSLFDLFKQEMSEMLIFLKHVTKITVSDISSGELKTEHEVCVSLTHDDRVQRLVFYNHISDMSSRIKKNEISIFEVEPFEVSYELHAYVNLEKQHDWFVVQRFGFANTDLRDNVANAITDGKLGMLPVGGVAIKCRTKESRPGAINNTPITVDGKAYCGLPLPENTGLPLHINGHFILDHEARRGLWREDEGYKTDWNKLLLSKVVAIAYVEAVKHVKSTIFSFDESTHLTETQTKSKLRTFENMLPIYKLVSDKYWKLLVTSIFRVILTTHEKLFPVTLKHETNAEEKRSVDKFNEKAIDKYNVVWSPMYQKGHTLQLFFVEKDSKPDQPCKLLDLLKIIGMKIASFSSEMQDSMKDADCCCNHLSPEAVIEFLKSNVNVNGRTEYECHTEKQKHVSDTKLRSVQNVDDLLSYCSQSKDFKDAVDALPLAVTNDGILRCFKTSQPLYCSDYCCLFKQSDHRFLHSKLLFRMSMIGKANLGNAVKDMHLETFVQLLSHEIPDSRLSFSDTIPWDPQCGHLPKAIWIRKIWMFLLTEFETVAKQEDHKKTHGPQLDQTIRLNEFLKPLDNWCLIPTKVTNSLMSLVKLSRSFIVLHFESFVSRPPLQGALEILAIPQFDSLYLPYIAKGQLIPYLASDSTPLLLLKCLNYHQNTLRLAAARMEHNDYRSILEYLTDNLDAMRKECSTGELKERLRALPFFFRHDGNLGALTDNTCSILVLPKEIPAGGLHLWASNTGTVLLRDDPTLHRLHQYLGLAYKDSIDVYLEHILKKWNCLPDSAIIQHLKYIKDSLLVVSMEGKFDNKQSCVIQKMRELELIPAQGVRKRAQDFVSPHNAVFRAMCDPEMFPPQCLWEDEWKLFLEHVGMIKEVTATQFVRFAHEVATEGSNTITDVVEKKSSTLVRCLLSQEKNWPDHIYNQISSIKFVVPFKVKQKYTNVHKQYNEAKCLMKFAGSISRRHQLLTWTSLPLLSSFSDPRNDMYSKITEREVAEAKEQMLSISHDPPVDAVILHCLKVFHSLKERIDHSENICNTHKWLLKFLDKVYGYLQKHGLQSKVRDRLYHTPIVYTPDRNFLTPAHQVVEELTSEQEISPYLLKAPTAFGRYIKLFIHLGASKTLSFLHYVNVLALIKREVMEQTLDDDNILGWGTIAATLHNLFLCLRQTHAHEIIPKDTVLYVPSRNRRLMDISQLVVSDNSYFEERLGRIRHLQFLIAFEELEIDCTLDDIYCLPTRLQPMVLSKMVKEEIDMSGVVEIPDSRTAMKLEDLLQSNHFIQGLLRLLKHVKVGQNKGFSDDEKHVSSVLSNVCVKEAEVLKTYLHLNGVRVDASVMEKECFIPIPESNESAEWCIYLQKHKADEDLLDSIDDDLIEFLVFICRTKMPENILSKIIHIKTPKAIEYLLDKKKISAYQLPRHIVSSVFPRPGTYVPEKLHHLLNYDFTEIGMHEYRCVALELEDADLLDDNDVADTYSPVYIYVRILRKVLSDSNSSQVNQIYKVSTGVDEVEVPGYKIYKFMSPTRRQENRDLVDTGIARDSSEGQSVEKMLYSVRLTLKQSWSLPNEARRHIIKRLYLRWHPDKNIGNEEFCTTVFRYIKEVISKLENGIPLEDGDETDGQFSQSRAYPDFTSSYYFRFCERMNNRTRSHRTYEQAFYGTDRGYRGRSSGHRSNFTHRESCKEPFNDLGEACRWQLQAKVDLRNAVETIDARGDPPAYNWVCYMCHQASEKSLKAAGFARDANTIDRTSHDIISLAVGFPDDIQRLASSLSNLVGVHTQMRYPDVLKRPDIPSTVYTRDQADQACEFAKQILELVKENYIS